MLRQKNIDAINQDRIIGQIQNYKVISFDIFDTLIKRDCAEGKNMFVMMERKLTLQYTWLKHFSQRRIQAEKRARTKSSKEEVTLADIYEELDKDYTPEQRELLLKTEIEYEMSLCHVNNHMLKVYNYCVSNMKDVILTSDMYLPYEVIQALLSKVGLHGYKKLYLSSQICLTKQTGNLYDYIIKDLGILPKEIVHIGDNKKSDVLIPMRRGIKSIHIPHVLYNNIVYNPNEFIQKNQIEDYMSLCSFIDNRIDEIKDEKYFERVGYELEGPLLIGFSKWLKQEFEKSNIEKIFFLSRDGQIMEKAYKRIWGENNKIRYMYASRRALIVPTLWLYSTLEEMVSVMFFPRVGSISAFIKKMGLESEKYISIAEEYDLNYEKIYSYEELFIQDSFKAFFDRIKEDIRDNSKKEYEILLEYLRQIGFSGKLAIVDIGWHGNMQKALVEICKLAGIQADIRGFYFGLNPNVNCEKKGIIAKGYLFQEGFNERYFELQRTFTAIFEMMFTADHGSVRKFKREFGVVKPELEKFEYDNEGSRDEFATILDIQKGALKFVEDIIKQPEFSIEWSANVVFQNSVLLGNAPDYEASCKFGNIKWLEGSIMYIAKPRKSMSFYILRLKQLKNDLTVNSWKIGFFRRLCKINLPYFEVYTMMRRIFLLWKKRKKI